MRYTDVNNSYLDTAVSRIGSALAALTGYKALYGPAEAYSKDDIGTFWYVGAVLMAETDIASELGIQVYTVASYLLNKTDQTKWDATIYSGMYPLIPQVFNYMQSHKRLIFDPSQDAILYLNSDRVKVSLSTINQGGQSGFSITHQLPFNIVLKQE